MERRQREGEGGYCRFRLPAARLPVLVLCETKEARIKVLEEIVKDADRRNALLIIGRNHGFRVVESDELEAKAYLLDCRIALEPAKGDKYPVGVFRNQGDALRWVNRRPFGARQRCEADQIHVEGQTTCGPKAQAFSQRRAPPW